MTTSRDAFRHTPLYGHQLSRAVTPFEAGLGRVVALGKESTFVGDKALAVRRDAGAQRLLVGLVSSGRRVAPPFHRRAQ